MSTVDILSPAGDKAGTVELPSEIFDVEKISIPLIHQVVVAQLAAARQGTHKTKRRGEGAGGGKKPYKQKGTGRARQGSIRAPQFAGGGVVLGANDEVNWVSLRNVPQVHLIEAGQLNTYDVLVSDAVVFTTEALEEFL